MKLRKTLAMMLAVLMLAFMAVPAVSAEENVTFLALEDAIEKAHSLLESGTGYTNESYVRLYMVMYEAESFLHKSDATESQAQALLEKLNGAIEGLETPVASGDEIPFTLVQECRVRWYGPDTSNSLTIVKSPAEMDAILENIHYTLDGEYPKPVRDEKYNEEFFKENSLVIGLYDFGSGSDRQSIDMMAVDGDTLTVYRTIRYPDGGTDDIQWRYALMEVRNSDIEGVVNVKDSFAQASLRPSEKVYGLWGDVNNDSKVNVKDATALQKHIAKLHMLFSANLFLADANGDGEVNIKDATDIQKCVADFELESSVGKLTKVCLTDVDYKTETVLTELHHTVIEARNQIVPGSNYVSSTLQNLMDEIEKSEELLESENPRNSDVLNQIQALKSAIDGLEYVNLHTDALVALMNEAQDYIDSGLYTEETTQALIEANFNALMVCLYGQDQSEVEIAEYELQVAIEALVLSADSPDGAVPFEILEEARIDCFGPDEQVVYLVKSPEEMDAVLENVDYFLGSSAVRDEKFNEEYFTEKSLVISLGFVGGGCCSQTIDKLVKSGDTLTLYRTIYKTANPTPDMNYQYVLIEVDNQDIAGVEIIRDTLERDYEIPDNSEYEESEETFRVYFANTKNWENVHIYYWSDNLTPYWPGTPMNFYQLNSYGQEVYYFDVPADVTGVVFNDVVTREQTEDITENIKDGKGFYPVELNSSGRWIVESLIGVNPEPVETSVADKPVYGEDETEILFSEASKRRIQGWGDDTETEEREIHIVRSVQEFEAVLERIKGSPDDPWEPKPVRDEIYNHEFFEERALVVCLYPLASGSYTFDTTRLATKGDTLTIYITVNMPSVSTCDMNYQYALLEVDALDVQDVNSTQVNVHSKYIEVEW